MSMICARQPIDPFCIEGPALISFSGGRTSAYMLRRILDEGLRPDVHVVFANTGKEREETLDFVKDCEYFWGVPVNWVERRARGEFVDVSHATASRDGEPFETLIAERKYLPNWKARFCTEELKIEAMRWFMESNDYETWTNVVGFRAEEQRRVSKTRQREATQPDQWSSVFPLHEAGVTKPDVLAYWARSPFDLQLGPHEGNCDLCFLKGANIRRSLIRARPESAIWWMKQERLVGARFRADSASYAELASQQPLALYEDADDLTELECYCHD